VKWNGQALGKAVPDETLDFSVSPVAIQATIPVTGFRDVLVLPDLLEAETPHDRKSHQQRCASVLRPC
jgi:hypothetical protein